MIQTAHHLNPHLPRFSHKPFLDLPAMRIRVFVQKNASGTHLTGQCQQLFHRISSTNMEPCPKNLEISIQGSQTSCQKPLTRLSCPMMTPAAPHRSDISWHHVFRLSCSPIQSGIVGNPQIPPKPMNRFLMPMAHHSPIAVFSCSFTRFLLSPFFHRIGDHVALAVSRNRRS